MEKSGHVVVHTVTVNVEESGEPKDRNIRLPIALMNIMQYFASNSNINHYNIKVRRIEKGLCCIDRRVGHQIQMTRE